MEYYKNILCFEAGWLIDNDIISITNYRNLTLRKHIQVVRRASRNTPALVAYDSMPTRFKEAIKTKIGGDPYQMAQQNILSDAIVHNSEASIFFNETYKLSDGRYLPKNTRQEYYANAIILDAIDKLLLKKRSKGGKMTKFWDLISDAVQSLDRTQYPHALPHNPRRLCDKYNLYKKDGFESLIHKNFANKNAARIDDDTKESLIIELLGDPRNLDNEQIARLYNMIAEQMNWRKISGAAVAIYRDRYDLETYAGRRGSVALYNNKMMLVKRSAPTKPLFYWTLDGWDVELLYQKFENGRTTYHNRPTVVVVLDPCCKYPIGFAVGTHETPELIKAALRNAAQHTAQLFGTMYRTHQIQSDRYSYKTLEPLYAAMGAKVTPARAKNAKSKVIEPYFGHLNKTYCQMLPNWSGFGITSNKEKQPNSEFLNKYKSNFPDFEGVCKQVVLMIEAERQAKYSEYMQHWSETDASDKLVLSPESYLYHFGETTRRKNLMQNDGLHVTIKGIRQSFDCFDIRFRQHASTQWSILYDPEDTSRILAINEDETLRFVLDKKYVQPMALKDRKAGDSEELKRINDFNKNEVVSYITDFRSATGDKVRNFFEENPQLNGTLTKLMLTDSTGQHKNVKYQERKQKAIESAQLEAIKKESKAGKKALQIKSVFDMF